MTIAMKDYGLTWTDTDGTPRASTVAYDKGSAGQRKTELEKSGATNAQIAEVAPGQLLQAKK